MLGAIIFPTPGCVHLSIPSATLAPIPQLDTKTLKLQFQKISLLLGIASGKLLLMTRGQGDINTTIQEWQQYDRNYYCGTATYIPKIGQFQNLKL